MYSFDLGVLVVFVYDVAVNVLLEHIHFGRRKLAGADSLLEQEIQLGKGAAGWLGHTEICVDDAEETDATLKHRVSISLTPRQGQISHGSQLTQKKPA